MVYENEKMKSTVNLYFEKKTTKMSVREVTIFCLPLQNLLLPFASLVSREKKSRVFFLFLVFEILEHLPYLYFSEKVTVPR